MSFLQWPEVVGNPREFPVVLNSDSCDLDRVGNISSKLQNRYIVMS